MPILLFSKFYIIILQILLRYYYLYTSILWKSRYIEISNHIQPEGGGG